MKDRLVSRIGDLDGVRSVEVDLSGDDPGGINIKLDSNADEGRVLENIRALLVAYGVRPSRYPLLTFGRDANASRPGPPVEVRVTPIKGGARVEVLGDKVRSFRIVVATPESITQGIADAWCQVMGRIPVEILSVSMNAAGQIIVFAARNGETRTMGTADVSAGWVPALTTAVGEAIGALPAEDKAADLAQTAW